MKLGVALAGRSIQRAFVISARLKCLKKTE